ncbi:MAG TPA: hypothetical protein VLG10_08110 [Methylomirabilota bacterium]|nr:hypothetical protein [Methylomirabilota bacterium]
MAGQPKKRATYVERLREIGIEEIADRIADGKLYRAIAAEFEVSYAALTDFLYEPENRAFLAAARRAGARAHVETAIEDAEQEQDPRMAGLQKLRADMRLHLARADDPDTFADKKNVNVKGELSVGQLHIHAMLKRGSTELPKRSEPAQLPPAVAEVIEDAVIEEQDITAPEGAELERVDP